MVPFDVVLKKNNLRKVNSEELKNSLEIFKTELLHENTNAVKNLIVQNDQLNFTISYFATGPANYFSFIRKGQFNVYLSESDTFLKYKYYIGGMFIHLIFFVIFFTLMAFDKSRYEPINILRGAFLYYCLGFAIFFSIMYITQYFFFRRVCKKICESFGEKE